MLSLWHELGVGRRQCGWILGLTNAVHVRVLVRKEATKKHNANSLERICKGICERPVGTTTSCFEHDDEYEQHEDEQPNHHGRA